MSYTTAFNNFVNSAAIAGWKECEKENHFYSLHHSPPSQVSAGIPMDIMAQHQPLSSSFEGQGQQGPSSEPAPVIKSELETLVTFLAKFDSKVAAIWGSDEQAEEEARKKKIMDDNNKNMMLLMMLNGGQGQTQNIGSGNDSKRDLQQQVWGQPLPSPIELSQGYGNTNWKYDNDNNNNEKQMRDMKIGDDDDMVVEEDLLTSVKTHFKPIQEAEEPCFGLWSLEDPTEYATYKRTADSTFPLRFKIQNENDKAVQTDDDFNYGNDEKNFSTFASNTSPWVTTSASSSMHGFASDEEEGVIAATDRLYLW